MRAPHAVVLGGCLAGILDILAAFAMTWPRVAPARVLQSIASGLIGPAAYQGGPWTAALGLALHFLIALTAAAVFVVASLRLRWLVARPVTAGLLYGVVVYLFMNAVVLPLSQIAARWPSWPTIVLLLLVHMVCVGLPIALVARKTQEG